MRTSAVLLSCLSLMGLCDSARILAVFPTPSISHQVVFRPLTQELVKRGHEVTVITTDPAFPKGQAPANLTEIDLHDMSYEIWRETFLKTVTGEKTGLTDQIAVMFHLFNVIFEKQLQTEEFQEILKKGEDYFDLLILELCIRQTLVLSHVFKAPVIQISSLGVTLDTYELLGGPTHPLLYPSPVRQRVNNLTMWEKDLKDYLDASKHGVIYMSFGTNTDPTLLPPEKIQVFIRVFSKLPYDVLWKWDGEELPGRTDNIKIKKWFPQSDLLRHPNVKAFVTQGGVQSTDEAIAAGVPLVGVPILGDQWYNTEKYERFKIGVKVDLEDISDEKFKDAVMKVTNDKSYRENIVRLRTLMHDQPQPPLERAVWWTEYVLRHGGAKHLRAPAAYMHWTEYYEIELVLIVLSVFLFTLFLSLYVVFKIYSYVSKMSFVKVKVS